METPATELIPDEEGNFSSPALAALLEVWEEYEDEIVDEEEVSRVIGRVRAYVHEKISELERDAESAQVDALDPNRVLILGAFQDHLLGLDKLSGSLRSGDFEQADHGFDLLQRATNDMVQGLRGLVDDEERYARVTCVQCSGESSKEESYCSHCGAILPKVQSEQQSRLIASEGPEEEDLSAETTPNFMEVSEAHEEWHEGRLEPELFYAVLEKVRARQAEQFAEIENELGRFQESEETAEAQQHLEQFAQTLVQNAQALDEMLNGLEQDDMEAVEAGFSAYAEATVALVELDRQAEELVAQ